MNKIEILEPITRVAADDLPPLEVAWIWGLPLARLDYAGVLHRVEALIARRRPGYFITANLQYAMLCDRDPTLAEINARAEFLLADGMPMVWWSRFRGQPLPERVAGSDLIYLLSAQAAEKGHRVFFLGGAPGSAQAAAAELARRYPGLQLAGIEAPEIDRLSPDEHLALIDRIRRSRADLLFAALGQPKGERWLSENCHLMEVPVSVQVGASFDFVAGRAARAPRWMQRTGLEWLHRMLSSPRRLAPRYFRNAMFLLRVLCRRGKA